MPLSKEFQGAFADVFGISTAIKNVNQLIGRHTRKTADPYISKKHGGHRGIRKAAILHL
jgi:hypothetical protein